MPMSSGGHVASSSGCATRPKVREIGLTGCAVPTQRSLLIGSYVMATAEHREPCDSRGSCTVLGAPGGEIPPGDSSNRRSDDVRCMTGVPLKAEVWPRVCYVAEVPHPDSRTAANCVPHPTRYKVAPGVPRRCARVTRGKRYRRAGEEGA